MMANKFEYTGQWWLPENTKRKAAGILRYNPRDGASLELMGSFTEKIDEQLDKKRYDIILGLTADSVPLTLEECAVVSGNINPAAFSTFEIRPSRLYAGAHFADRKKICFKKVLAGYTYLDEWLGISGFRVSKNHEDNEIIVKYKLPGPVESAVNEKLKLDIDFHYEMNGGTGFRKDLRINQRSCIRFEFGSAVSTDEILKYIYNIGNFISLAVNRSSQPVEVTALSGNDEVVIIDSQFDLPPAEKKISVYDMAFTYKDISRKFSTCINKWLAAQEVIGPVYSIFFAAYHKKKISLPHQFLSYIQALEIYHQRAIGGEYQNMNDFKKTAEALISAVPENISGEFRKSIERCILNMNEYPLEKRLADIFKKYKRSVDRFISKREQFIDEVAGIRNHFVNYNRGAGSAPTDTEDLLLICERLKYIIIICLLSEIGIDKKLIERNQHRAMQLYT